MTARYEREGDIATITIDDGKVNALSFEAFAQIEAALDRAIADRAPVVITGREGVFSAGFDLKVLRRADAEAGKLVIAGFALAKKIFAAPIPVVVACTGHAVAMGTFLVLSGDVRIGVRGEYRLGANEVQIGLVVPYFAVELCRQRLSPACFHRAVETSEMFSPDDAVQAGILDRVVAPAELKTAAREAATRLAGFDRGVYAATKQRTRGRAIETLTTALDQDRDALGAIFGR